MNQKLFLLIAVLILPALGACKTATRSTASALTDTPTSKAELFLGRQNFHPSFAPGGDLSALKVAFFDADSTLRIAPSGSLSANGPKDVLLLPHMKLRLKYLADNNFLIVIVSNQGGVADGYVTLEVANAALDYTAQLIHESGGIVHYYDFAEAKDMYRKPEIGMATRLRENLKARFGTNADIDLKNSFMVGDSAFKKLKDVRLDGAPGTHFSNADRMFAKNVGIQFYEPSDFFGWRANGVDVFVSAKQVEEYLLRVPEPTTCDLVLWKSPGAAP